MLTPSRVKISLITATLALVLVVVAYIYSLWTVSHQKTAEKPLEAVSMMMRDILQFHEKRGEFPNDLGELVGVVWEAKERRYSIKKRALNHRNYYYFYSRISHHQFTLWAIPTGVLREDSPSWFLVLTPETCHRWKGAALPLDQVKDISAAPTLKQLGLFGLIEQPTLNFKKEKKSLLR